MKEAYRRNIKMMVDGEVWGVTSVATLAEDLIFFHGCNRIDSPEMYHACIALANAYVNGDERGELERRVGVTLDAD